MPWIAARHLFRCRLIFTTPSSCGNFQPVSFAPVFSPPGERPARGNACPSGRSCARSCDRRECSFPTPHNLVHPAQHLVRRAPQSCLVFGRKRCRWCIVIFCVGRLVANALPALARHLVPVDVVHDPNSSQSIFILASYSSELAAVAAIRRLRCSYSTHLSIVTYLRRCFFGFTMTQPFRL